MRRYAALLQPPTFDSPRTVTWHGASPGAACHRVSGSHLTHIVTYSCACSADIALKNLPKKAGAARMRCMRGVVARSLDIGSQPARMNWVILVAVIGLHKFHARALA